MNTNIKDVFYNIFWQDKSCQNLFMLSKNEFLDTKIIEFEGNKSYFSLPRIIISNVSTDDDNRDVLKYRAETHGIQKETLIENTVNNYEPIVIQFLETTFGKAYNKLINDIEKNPMGFIFKVGVNLLDSEDPELEVIKLLQEYDFIPKHLNDLKELEGYVRKEGLSKNYKKLVNEENYRALHDMIRSAKDLYLNINFQELYDSNQILVNSLYDTDNFKSRIKLFTILYEHQIIQDSGEDCFVECINCSPGTYKGTLHLKISPKNLSKLKCIHCNKKLTYYVPYKLNDEIFKIVNAKDGILIDLFEDICIREEVDYDVNINFLNDIEIDGGFDLEDCSYIIEMKMYENRIGLDKIKSKIKRHVNKLSEDLLRIRDGKELEVNRLESILLVNILDDKYLKEIEQEIYRSGQNEHIKQVKIMNVNMLIDFIEKNLY